VWGETAGVEGQLLLLCPVLFLLQVLVILMVVDIERASTYPSSSKTYQFLFS
jgi:hypothetical protein